MNAVTQYKQRINAQRLMLQAEIDDREALIEADLHHFAATLPSMIKDEVLEEVKDSSPIIAKVMTLLQGKPVVKSPGRSQADSTPNQINVAGSLLQAALPIIYTIGSQKILSYSLRSAGKLVRFGVRQLFGIGRKRKR